MRCAYDEMGRRFAVKMSRRDLQPADDVHLDLEAEIVAHFLSLDPGLADVVVPVVDLGTLEGRRVLVMPWLDHRLDEAADLAGFGTRLEIAAAFARSVARLRGADRPTGLVHRDLKPSNAFVERSDRGLRVWLSDLGGAWRLDAPVGPAEQLYSRDAAPIDQRLASHAAGVDPTWDVYATAVSLFRVITGRPLRATADAHRHLTYRGRQALAQSPLDRASEPLHRLLRVGRMRPMLPDDLKALARSVSEGSDHLPLGRRHQRTAARSVALRLRQLLEPALDPIPSRRPGDVRALAAGLTALHRRWAALQSPRETPLDPVDHRIGQVGCVSIGAMTSLLLILSFTVDRCGESGMRRVEVGPPKLVEKVEKIELVGWWSSHRSDDGSFEEDLETGGYRAWIRKPGCPWWTQSVWIEPGSGTQRIELVLPSYCPE